MSLEMAWMNQNHRRTFQLLSALAACLLSSSAFAQSVVTTDLQVPTQGWATNWLTVSTPVNGGFGSFHGTYGPTPNPGDPNRPDQAFALGWNVKNDGHALVPGEPALMWRFEDYYNPQGTGSFMESHLQYVNQNGMVLRPYALQINRGTDVTAIVQSADAWSYMDRASQAQYLKAMPGALLLLNGMRIIAYTNNQSNTFQMMNAAGTGTIRLPYVNNLNQTVIDVDRKGTIFGANVDAPGFSSGGKAGVTVSGTNCTITSIMNGLITGATCS
jgi:hypothetical protein